MPRRDIVVMGASAGGIEALQKTLGGLPPDLDAAVLVVLHVGAHGGGRSLAAILDRAGPLPAVPAVDGERLRAGRIYVCVADHHLLLADGHVRVRRGPKENGNRPAADPLFRSAARYFGPRVIGVVLSGTLSDGTAGLAAIKRQGGIAVVQHPDDAIYDGMPTYAIDHVEIDHVRKAADLGPLLADLVREEVPADEPEPSPTMLKEVTLVENDDRAVEHDHPGRPSPWPCPDCNGVLWHIDDDDDDDDVLRFRCRVGHAWSAESLLAQQDDALEQALWTALRALEDRLALSETMADRAEKAGRESSARRFRSDLDILRADVEVLRGLLNAGAATARLLGNEGGR